MAAASSSTCSEAGCTNAAARGGRCWTCAKRHQRGGLKHPGFGERYESPMDRLREAAHALADADDDEGFRQADDRLRKAALAVKRRSFAEATQKGMAAARAEGVHVGRPRSVDDAEITQVVAAVGGTRRAAKLLRLSRGTVRRALARARAGVGAKGTLLDPPRR